MATPYIDVPSIPVRGGFWFFPNYSTSRGSVTNLIPSRISLILLADRVPIGSPSWLLYCVWCLGSDQAIFRISLANRCRNICFQALYYSFWHQNGPHRKSLVHEAQTSHPLNRLGYHIPTRKRAGEYASRSACNRIPPIAHDP